MSNMTVIAAENWANLTSGDIIGSVINVNTGVMGIWFYVFFMLATMAMISLSLIYPLQMQRPYQIFLSYQMYFLHKLHDVF